MLRLRRVAPAGMAIKRQLTAARVSGTVARLRGAYFGVMVNSTQDRNVAATASGHDQ